jgi:hypothetical protein
MSLLHTKKRYFYLVAKAIKQATLNCNLIIITVYSRTVSILLPPQHYELCIGHFFLCFYLRSYRHFLRYRFLHNPLPRTRCRYPFICPYAASSSMMDLI